jgi:molybdate transport system substrate-binding protein
MVRLLFLLSLLFFPPPSFATELLVSSAAGISSFVKEAGELFFKESGVKVSYNISSSGRIAKQIEMGAPTSLFVSASKYWIDYLSKLSLLEEETVFPFATTRLVVVAPKDSSLKSLKEAQTIAVGNRFAPVGSYAVESLKNLGLYDELKERLVYAPTVKQIALWVASGNADAGIIYYSDYLAYKDRLRLVGELPPDSHSPIYFYAACVKESEEKKACRDFGTLLKELPPSFYRKFGFEKVEW